MTRFKISRVLIVIASAGFGLASLLSLFAYLIFQGPLRWFLAFLCILTFVFCCITLFCYRCTYAAFLKDER